MARLYSCGFELQSVTVGMEFNKGGLNNNGTGGGGIVTANMRSGAACMRLNMTAANNWFGQVFKSAVSTTQAQSRIYIKFNSLPTGQSEIMGYWNSGAATRATWIRFDNTTSTLQLMNTSAVQIGSNSAAITTGVWYIIELLSTGTTTNATVTARLGLDDGSTPTSFATSTTAASATFDACYLGTPQTVGTYDMLIDDWVINDSVGAPSSFPGPGLLTFLQPNAAGDNNGWLTQVGGTAGSANNFTRVNEVPPNDVTSYNASATISVIDDFNITNTPSTIGANDTINVVQVGVRYTGASASADSAFQVRIKKASAGTVTSSTAITPASVTWFTNAAAAPFLYPLTLPLDPGGSAWTKASLDTTQIGYAISTSNTNAARISNIWMYVDSTPAPPVNTGATLAMMGV